MSILGDVIDIIPLVKVSDSSFSHFDHKLCTGRDSELYLLSLQAQQGIAAAPLVAAAATTGRFLTSAELHDTKNMLL